MTMLLDGDCSTDTTIDVPDGFTLDGQGHTITAVDNPTHGTFLGAVVRNELGAGEMHVVNLIITTDNIGNVCQGGDDRLRGIMFRSASGTVEGVTVTDIRKSGESTCQEGNAIEISNPPFSFAPAPHTTVGHPDTKHVWVLNSTVERYQKTGIIANGDVSAWIVNNTVVGIGPIDYNAQNGIQLGFGATGVLEDNDVSGNDFTPDSTFSAGILLFLSGTTLRDNLVHDNEVGISANLANGTLIEMNQVVDSRTKGIHLAGSTNMTVLNNQVLHSGTDGIHVAGGTNPFSGIHYHSADNAIEKNRVEDSGDSGIVIQSGVHNTTITDNKILNNTIGVHLIDGVEDAIELRHNYFSGNEIGLENAEGNPTADARWNYWGCSEGPDDAGCDPIVGDVLYDPWLTEPAYTGSTSFEHDEDVIVAATMLDSNGDGVAGIEVEFFVDDESVGMVMTNETGVASLNLGPQTAGDYDIRAEALCGCLVAEATVTVKGEATPPPDPEPECPAVSLHATANEDGSITVSGNASSEFDLYRKAGGGEAQLIGTFDGEFEYHDTDTVPGKSYTYFAMDGDETCALVEVTAIPVFPTVLAAVAAVALSVLGYAVLRRRK